MTISRVLAIAAVLIGCSGAADHGTSSTPTAVGGPWAQEFSAAMSDSSPYEQQILADGVITAAERADAQSRVRSCMRDAGYDFRAQDDGTSEATGLHGKPITDSEAANSARRQCADRFDKNVTYLFGEIRRNPERHDEAEITVRCLRASGVMGKEYTERDWRRQNDTGRFSFDEYSVDAVQCRLDPLGSWLGR
ncbi:hypothetical protein [Curtobacterium sp. RRHDQ10]|uniref:hypothetical protein n=1 Tax=Curtobacterium phyllosphaerae TaxID=3413379 RepID=UPI003BEFF585